MDIKPEVDKYQFAKEVKDYIQINKYNYVDHGYTQIEMWPNPNDDTYPEIKKFSNQWESIFNYADELMKETDDASLFPHDLIKIFEKATTELQEEVNLDFCFWSKLKEEIIPMYEKSKQYEYWKTRWSAVKIFYDPIGLDVTSSRVLKNSVGEIKEREVISSRSIPAGFVIQIL